ncbi:MAG: hypothetical protein GF311_10610 [Candidatus Lokiarchaeota archaeon]|jgi:hypothetical protein|nr:hypothetical protein [Candidatus Lokiarchaeota archaeon]
MTNENAIWAVQLDWLNILEKLGLSSIDKIPEYKRTRAIRNIGKTFSTEELLELSPEELDELVANELKDLMKKELSIRDKKQKEMAEKFKNNIIPMKQGGIIKINPKDLKDLDLDGNPEDIIKYFYKKFFGGKGGDDNDDDTDNVSEDKTGYYI